MSPGHSGQVVILDRDGTIVIDRNYLGDPAGLEFLPGALNGVRRMRQLGCRLVVISNQSGVGRGLLTLEQVERVNRGLTEMMELAGVPLDATYYCPHAPGAGCNCRKPETGLLLQAAEELGFEPSSAIVIGDKVSDIELGQRVGAISMLVTAGRDHLTSTDGVKPTYFVSGLDEAAAIIESLRSPRD